MKDLERKPRQTGDVDAPSYPDRQEIMQDRRRFMKLLGGMALGLVVGGSGAFADDNPPAPGGMMPAPQPPEPIPPKPDDEKPEGDNKEEKKPEEGDKPTDPDYVTGGVMVEPEDPPPPPEPEKEPSKEYELDGDVALPREPEPDK